MLRKKAGRQIGRKGSMVLIREQYRPPRRNYNSRQAWAAAGSFILVLTVAGIGLDVSGGTAMNGQKPSP
jgi:hypothetical protein